MTPVRWITRVWTVVEVMTSTTDQGQERQPGLERREREVHLQEVGEEQKHREDPGSGHQQRGVRPSASPVPHDVQGQ